MITVKKFSASWCGPCSMLKPIIENLKINNPDVSFVDIDVDEQYEQAQRYSIRSVPTVVVEKNGTEVQRLTGLQSELTYRNIISELRVN